MATPEQEKAFQTFNSLKEKHGWTATHWLAFREGIAYQRSQGTKIILPEETKVVADGVELPPSAKGHSGTMTVSGVTHDGLAAIFGKMILPKIAPLPKHERLAKIKASAKKRAKAKKSGLPKFDFKKKIRK